MNICDHGNSLLELEWKPLDESMVGEVHYKHLIHPTIDDSEYVQVVDGQSHALQQSHVLGISAKSP